MKIIGCDLHARQQTIAMLDSDTGELEEKTLRHEGDTVREFYGRAGNRMPRRSSSENPQSRNTQTKAPLGDF